MKKRGISNVVAVVLIILIAVIAASILWLIISKLSSGPAPVLEDTFTCMDIKILPVSCIYNNTEAYVLFETKISGDASLAKIILILEKDDFSTVLQELDGLEVVSFEVNSFLYKIESPPGNFGVAAKYKSSDGNIRTCTYPERIKCGQIANPSGNPIIPP